MIEGYRERYGRLPQSSAYRNLVVLEQARVVHRLVTHADFARYELAEDLTGHHHHLVCDSCGLVMPFSDEALERAIDKLSERVPLRVSEHEIVLHGSCHDCRDD